MAKRTETTAEDIAAHLRVRDGVDRADFDWWLSRKGWSWQGLARGDYDIDLDRAQQLYVFEDPVLWARAFMVEPDSGEPYEFWDYQKPSIRAWQQNVVHQDGAEVGKTREIVALILWGMNTAFGLSVRRPSMLVAAPQQIHLDEIIADLEFQVGAEDGAERKAPVIGKTWLKPTKSPHYEAHFQTPLGRGKVYFRPGGHDGVAFRGVHVNGMLVFDEAAKAHSDRIWSEFWRAGKPGHVARIYSVPDGVRDTQYYRLTQQAREHLPPGEDGWRLFHWPKTIQPDPFWSDKRRRELIEAFGGEDQPGYQRNVLGLHGQEENPVFPYARIEPNLREVPEYRALHLVENSAEDSLQVTAYSIDFLRGENGNTGQPRYLIDRHDSLAGVRSKDRELIREVVNRLVREVFEPQGPGLYWLGADLGQRSDPTEIMLWRELGDDLRRIARIRAKHLSYDFQCELIYALDRLFGFQASLGIDLGSAGAAVVQMLRNLEDYEDADYDDRLSGFNFAQNLDYVDENGEVLEQNDPATGEPKPERMPAKVLATELLLHRMQRAGFSMPYDPDLVQDYVNHTAREGERWPIYSKKRDHTIDADRLAMLRRAFNETADFDVFSADIYDRTA